ncbi:MAG TPA: GAF domain-containing protein, partial [Glaciecola sp.]|nr:GAF domain-containing protein [Glaciecola sp.]
GHIACDAASNSEIVLPLVVNGELFGVLDIDAPIFDRFTAADETGLTQLAVILVNHLERMGL